MQVLKPVAALVPALLSFAAAAPALAATPSPAASSNAAGASHLAIVVKIKAKAGTPTSSARTSVTFTAWVNPNGYPGSYCFDYGLTGKYDTINGEEDPEWKDGETNYQFLPGVSGAMKVSGYVYGLRPGLTYHYRIVVTGDGTTTSKDKTFKTAK